MAVSEEERGRLAAKFEVILPHLDERQRRLLLGAEARVLGHGGIRAVARAAGVREGTVAAGVDELEAGVAPLGRVRRAGGGRKPVTEHDPALMPALLGLVEPDERGDPMSPLRWTTKSLRHLAQELAGRGHKAGPDTIAALLHGEGFSLQGNAKTLEGRRHPDRDAQFGYINEQVKDYLSSGDPVVSVDTKKKELVGAFANKGREWRPAGEPAVVRTHDFADPQLGQVIPYGVYDLAADTGWVAVGTDHNTAAFAVATLRRWWDGYGRDRYPNAGRLLITADAGGSNGYRTRAWKTDLAALAAEIGLPITVCHFPPGTSKWNRIEHRLFAHISMNWRARPLTSHETIVHTIAATTTSSGLRVHAELDTGHYPTGVVITDEQMSTLAIDRHDWHGDWNYTLRPDPATPAGEPATALPPLHHLAALVHPAITGMPDSAWNDLISRLTVPHQAQHEAFLHNLRGHARPRGGGRKIRVTLSHQLLATLLHDRYQLPRKVIADLFGVAGTTINVAIRNTRTLLTQIQHPIEPSNIRLTNHTDLAAHTRAAGFTAPALIKTAS
ncbi:ISAzo13 family transposase [Actinoplanes sp. NBC_00393]|uniref:ISAzo13 family transposase n=1 Tax=Actinoplanes sp. NBC_00393 TaxID=2975953 RepID=UPI003FA404EC